MWFVVDLQDHCVRETEPTYAFFLNTRVSPSLTQQQPSNRCRPLKSQRKSSARARQPHPSASPKKWLNINERTSCGPASANVDTKLVGRLWCLLADAWFIKWIFKKIATLVKMDWHDMSSQQPFVTMPSVSGTPSLINKDTRETHKILELKRCSLLRIRWIVASDTQFWEDGGWYSIGRIKIDANMKDCKVCPSCSTTRCTTGSLGSHGNLGDRGGRNHTNWYQESFPRTAVP